MREDMAHGESELLGQEVQAGSGKRGPVPVAHHDEP
jgi:hypothetical protein